MPWTGSEFSERHNHSLHGERATHAAHIANAILGRGVPEGEAIATANKWAQHHRDYGGGLLPTALGSDPTAMAGIGGLTPSAQTQNPLIANRVSRLQAIPTEKLAELSARMGGGQQGQLIQHLLQQRRMLPNTPGGQQTQPQQPLKSGGAVNRLAGGPMGVSPSEAEPWWTRAEARSGAGSQSGSGFLHGTTMGRADDVNATVPAGSYVWPADVIAGVGEGNSLAGARIMQAVLDSGPHGIPQVRGSRGMGPPRPPREFREEAARGGPIKLYRDGGAKSSGVKAKLSHGELVSPPAHALAWGDGDITRGHRIFDKWVVALRKDRIAKDKKLPGPVKT